MLELARGLVLMDANGELRDPLRMKFQKKDVARKKALKVANFITEWNYALVTTSQSQLQDSLLLV